MKIYDATNKLILEVEVDDTSYRYRTIGGDHNLILKYSLPKHIELPVGAYVVFETQTYVLQRPQDFKMKHTRNYEYTVTFESPQANAKIWKFRNTVDGRLKFSLTAKPHEHLEMFVANMNRRDTGWTVGQCIDGTEKCINYDHDYCWDAIGKMASEFNTEFEIKGKQVSLRKVEYNKGNPLPLSYGCGNGFQSGVGRSNSGDKPPIEILYVQGGTENIDPSKYGNKELLLPKNQTIRYDGEHFEDEAGFNAANARRYVVDDLGLSIRRADKNLSSLAEDSLDASEIYPKRVGTVSQWITVDKEGHLYDFVDNTIPNDLNYENYLIEGETMTVVFQTGMLAGKEFEVKYYHDPITNKYDASKNKVGRRFEILPQDIDGETMPNDIFKAAAGKDTYAVFKCALPDSYICNNATKTGASWDMFREAVKYLYDNEEEKYTFSGTLDGLWAKKDWVNIGGKIILGGFVRFFDKNFLQEGVLVRIVGIKDYINNPHSPSIELSNETRSASFGTKMGELVAQEVEIEDNYKAAVQFTKRRWQDAKETITMLEKALLDNFTNRINPIAVETMSVLVGDESLQFRFVNNMTNPQVVNHVITYDQEELQLNAPAGIVQHMTLDIDTITSEHKPSEYHFWNVAQFTSAHLIDGSKSYYLYIKASRNNQTAVFELSETAHKMFENSSVYYFLVGVLNKEFDGERSFVTLYGFTEILPGRVTTDKVVSGDGNSFFDLLANAMKLGDRLKFNIDGDGKLVLNGTLVQSQSGDTEYIGCYRGVYNSTYTYYQGDLVTYTDTSNNVTSTYRHTSSVATRNIPPTNTTYWAVYAQGSRPNTSFKSTIFKRQNTAPTRPTGGSFNNPVPSGWSDGVPDGEAILWASVRVLSSDGEYPQDAQWSVPKQMTDTANFDVEFSSVANPSAPTGHPNTNKQWSNTADSTTIWMATSRKSNGVWDDWEISKIKGEKGDDGIDGAFRSTVFLRSNETPKTPTGGTYASPIPTSTPKWSDGIPSGSAILWESVCTFYGAGGSSGWSTPAQVTDTATLDIEFSPRTTQPSAPSGSTPFSNHESEGWYDPSSKNFATAGTMIWRAERKVRNGAYEGSWAISRIYGEKGNKGDDGSDGNFTELRYATNGSTTVPPSLSNTSRNPTGWSTTVPSVSTGYYLWVTMATINGDTNALIGTWSTPIRMSGADGSKGDKGDKGDSPVLVFRGNYSGGVTYIGSAQRLDCVKYGNQYYITRIDVSRLYGQSGYGSVDRQGAFVSIEPTDTNVWNSFGASFESIATNLLLAEGANIGDWFMSGGKIVSTLATGSIITLDAKNKKISIEALNGTYDYQKETSTKNTVNLSASNGIVETRNDNYHTSYLSPTGVFANRAGTQCVSAATGFDQRASIVGLGQGNLNKSDWFFDSDANLVCGVYGNASNSGTAPYFGGYFYNLRVNGLILKTKYITTNNFYLTDQHSMVVGFSSETYNVYLPAATREGQTIFVKQWWSGTMRFYPRSGQKIYDDNSENEYYEFGHGYAGMFTFVKASLNGTPIEVWVVSRWRF